MKIVESIKPDGYEEWAKRAAEKVQQNPETFQPGGSHEYVEAGGESYVTVDDNGYDEQERTSSEGRAPETSILKKGKRKDYTDTIKWEPEPALEASQYVARGGQCSAFL